MQEILLAHNPPVEWQVERQVYSVEEAAQVLGVSRSHLYEQIRLGRVPCVRIGRRMLVPVTAVERLLNGM